MGSSQSKPRSIKQLGVQICGARLGRRNKGWRKRRTVNDGSVSRSLDDIVSISLSIRISTRERGGRKRGRTTFSANGTHDECPRGRRGDWWTAKGIPRTRSQRKQRQHGVSARSPMHADPQWGKCSSVPLTSNEFVSPRSDRSYFGVKLDRVALQGDTFVPLLFFSDLHAERRTEFP